MNQNQIFVLKMNKRQYLSLVVFGVLHIAKGINIDEGEEMDTASSYNIQVTADQNFEAGGKEKEKWERFNEEVRNKYSSLEEKEGGNSSKFKYLFFEILTPEEYNDVIYLGDDLMNRDFNTDEKHRRPEEGGVQQPAEQQLHRHELHEQPSYEHRPEQSNYEHHEQWGKEHKPDNEHSRNEQRMKSYEQNRDEHKSSPYEQNYEHKNSENENGNSDHEQNYEHKQTSYEQNNEQRYRDDEQRYRDNEHLKSNYEHAMNRYDDRPTFEHHESEYRNRDYEENPEKINAQRLDYSDPPQRLPQKMPLIDYRVDEEKNLAEQSVMEQVQAKLAEHRANQEDNDLTKSTRNIDAYDSNNDYMSRQSEKEAMQDKKDSDKSDNKKDKKWQSFLDELSGKIKNMNSGIHRIDLDEMMDLDLRSPLSNDQIEATKSSSEDQESSNTNSNPTSIPRITPPEGSHKAMKPKRQIDRTMYDVHRPSSHIKELIDRTIFEGADYPTQSQELAPQCPYITPRPPGECYNAPPYECRLTHQCPKGALCCFDGCINLCWRPPTVSIHTQHPQEPQHPTTVSLNTRAPGRTYVPPGKGSTPYPPYFSEPSIKFIPNSVSSARYHESKSLEPFDFGNHIVHKSLPVHSQSHTPTPAQQYLPPNEEPANPSYSTTTTYAPPTKKYLPPDTKNGGYHTEMSTKYAPPAKEYIPPKTKSNYAYEMSTTYAPPTKGYLTPKPTYKSMSTKYAPPAKEYIPPKSKSNHAYEMSTTYAPPTKGYLPPKSHKSIYESMSTSYAPPAKEYIPPKSKSNYAYEMSTTYAPPTKGYIPPKTPTPTFMSSTYSPPKKDYLPPASPAPSYEERKPLSYAPPNKDYLPPASPQPTVSIKTHSTYAPPEKEYLPPRHSKPEYNHHMQGKEYTNSEHSKPSYMSTTYSPPANDYIPPESHNKPAYSGHMSTTLAPPKKEYLPPAASPIPDYREAHPTSYAPPAKDYLPPQSYNKPAYSGYMSTTLAPPKKKYLPPAASPIPDYRGPQVTSYAPPAKDYLPPQGHNKPAHSGYMSTTLAPPKKNYLPPAASPIPDYKGPKPTAYAPPTRDYLPPKSPKPTYSGMMQTTYSPPGKDYLPPATPRPSYHEESHYSTTISPPSKAYLPPGGSTAHPSKSGHHGSTMLPPNKNYLLPKNHGAPNYSTMSPPGKDYNAPHASPIPEYHAPDHHYGTSIRPPQKDYLPPKSNDYHPKPTHEESHNKAVYQPPREEYLPPHPSPKPTIIHKGHLEISTVRPGYQSTFKPPVKGYLPPPQPTLPPPTPNREYQSPLEETTYHRPDHPIDHYSHPSGDLTLCPHFQESSYCTPAHECWSPGVPDEDCPHNGFCCFDGCNNVCLKDNNYHTSFHIPKHNAHKLPGHDYVHLTQDNKVITDAKYRTPIEEMVYHLVEVQDDPADYVVPAKHDYEEHRIKEVYEIPIETHDGYDYQKPHAVEVYKPPVKEYLPPKVPDYTPPEGHHVIHHEVQENEYHTPKPAYELPKKEYLPPKEIYHSKPLDSYNPPEKEYLPPTPSYSLPPQPKAPIAAYTPPPFTKPSIATYSPPPKAVEPIAAYVPPPHKVHPVATYTPAPPAPVKASYKSHEDENHHEVHEISVHPSAEYSPPDDHHKLPKGLHDYAPTNEDYRQYSGIIPHAINIQINIPPASDRVDTGEDHYIPPQHKKEYVSPLNADYSKSKDSYEAPEIVEYHPYEDKHSKEHYSPSKPYYKHSEEHYSTPKPSYEKPKEHHKPEYDHSIEHYSPPKESYIPPKMPEYEAPKKYKSPRIPDYDKKYEPPALPAYHATPVPDKLPYVPQPTQLYNLPKSYETPSKGYSAPQHSHHSEYSPPQKNYLPAHKEEQKAPSYEHKQQSYSTYEAPSKDYLPPDPHHGPHEGSYNHASPKPSYKPDYVEFAPPHHGYLPPPDKPSYNPEYHEPAYKPDHLAPPSHGYLPPDDKYSYESKHHKPSYKPEHHKPSYKPDHLAPPSHSYLPPPDKHSYEPDYHKPSYKPDHLAPPSHGYLPPPDRSSYEPDYHKPSYKPDHLAPPSHGYLPPDKQEYHKPSYKPEHHKQSYKPAYYDHLMELAPPSSGYLPPDPHKPSYKPSGYSPQPDSYKPSYKPTEYLPPKVPLDANLHSLSPPHGSYLPPTGPLSHKDTFVFDADQLLIGNESRLSEYSPPTKNYLPPVHGVSKHPAQLYQTPGSNYLPGKELLQAKPSYHPENELLLPPKGDYLPPRKPGFEIVEVIDGPGEEIIEVIETLDYDTIEVDAGRSANYIVPPTPSDYIPPPPPPELISEIDEPELSVSEPLSASKLKYSPPPPRSLEGSQDLVVFSNSHSQPPNQDLSDVYIPPKTANDVPSNFLRPDEVSSIDDLPLDDDLLSFLDEELESLGLPRPFLNQGGAFLGLAKFKDPNEVETFDNGNNELSNDKDKLSAENRFEKLVVKPTNEIPLPPMPTAAPEFIPIAERLSPEVLAELKLLNKVSGMVGKPGFIPGKAGVDYPDFKIIPETDFTCQNFLLPGFYADTFTSCQVFHVCEQGERQSSFLCPKGTIFNQKFRVCDWWYNVKCEDASEFFDLNLDVMLLEGLESGPRNVVGGFEESLGDLSAQLALLSDLNFSSGLDLADL